jgi:ribosomal protein S27AE
MVYQLEPQHTSQHLPHMPCPHCKQTTMVQHGSLYACVSCGYRRDISDEGQSFNPLAWLAIGGLILLLI